MVYVPGEGYVVCKVQKTASGGRMELRQPSRHPAVSANRFNGGECDAGGFRIRHVRGDHSVSAVVADAFGNASGRIFTYDYTLLFKRRQRRARPLCQSGRQV